MQQEQITAIFDQQAASYDEKWRKLSPVNGALHLLTSAVFSTLPPTANILCVGAGTGAEVLYLAQRFPGWRFTAVEPSAAMLTVFQRRAEEHGISSRCVFHCGYLDSLPLGESFDAATAFLVSQFIIEHDVRVKFFRAIANRLQPEGILVSSDLAGDLATLDNQSLLEVWFQLMKGGGVPSHELEKMREAYTRDVDVRPPSEVCNIIGSGGFDSPVAFYQAGLIHAWYARRQAGLTFTQ